MNVKQQLFTVYDSKAQLYSPPTLSHNRATATREFTVAVTSEGHQFNTHAEDFTLFHIGEWDAEAGTAHLHQPETVARAHEVLALHQAENANGGEEFARPMGVPAR